VRLLKRFPNESIRRIALCCHYLYREKIDAQNSRLTHLSELVQEYREKLKGASPAEATKLTAKYEQIIKELDGEVLRLKTAGGASIDVVGSPVWTFERYRYVVRWTVHVTSKLQRSGVTLNVRSRDIMDFKVVPKTNQYSKTQSLIENDEARSIYIRQPIGIYLAELELNYKNSIQFSYKFEGDKESQVVTWKVP